MQRKQNQCRYCGVTTWNQDFAGFMRDHDRPDGRRCQKAAKEYETTADDSDQMTTTLTIDGTTGAMAVLAVATILRHESERQDVAAIRAADPTDTQEMPVVTMAELVGVAA